jgi:hypothetical protein
MTRSPPPLFARPESEYAAMMVGASLRFEGCSHVEMAILLRRMLDKLLHHFVSSEREQYGEFHKSLDAGGDAA